MKNELKPELWSNKCSAIIFKIILAHFCSLYDVDMEINKYCTFGYASMCGNITFGSKTVV